jgi:hypothetical protein
MNNIMKPATLMALVMLSAGVSAATFDGSKPLLCATQTVNECISGYGCSALDAADVNLPDFLEVDAANNVILGATTQTPVERVEHLDGKLILQGADDGVEGVRDGIAWTLVIAEDTGKMILNAAGDAFSVVVFGACRER